MKIAVIKIFVLSFFFMLFGHLYCGAADIVSDTDNSNPERKIVISGALPNPMGEDNLPQPEGEWVEIKNVGREEVSLAGWVLYTSSDKNELFLTSQNILPEKGLPTLKPGEKTKVFRNGDSDFSLSEDKDSIRLFSGPVEMEGDLEAIFEYEGTEEGVAVLAREDSEEGRSVEGLSFSPGETASTIHNSNGKTNIQETENENKSSAPENNKEGEILIKKSYFKFEENPKKTRAEEFDRVEKTFIAGTGSSGGLTWLDKIKHFFDGFSFKIFIFAWAVIAAAIITTRKILQV